MISVALTSFNGLRFIGEQVDSILSQLGAEDELVISDNGSTDGTWAWLENLSRQDPRVRLFQNLEFRGVVANFNFALQQCRGDLVFLADQDDRWHPGKVATMGQVFTAFPKVCLVQSDADLIDQNGAVVAPSFYALRKSGPGFWKNFARNSYHGCTLAFRRALLDTALPIPVRVPMHDMWLGLLAELTGEVRFIPDCLTSYRRHDENLSALTPRSPWQILAWRVALAATLSARLVKHLVIQARPRITNKGKMDEHQR